MTLRPHGKLGQNSQSWVPYAAGLGQGPTSSQRFVCFGNLSSSSHSCTLVSVGPCSWPRHSFLTTLGFTVEGRAGAAETPSAASLATGGLCFPHEEEPQTGRELCSHPLPFVLYEVTELSSKTNIFFSLYNRMWVPIFWTNLFVIFVYLWVKILYPGIVTCRLTLAEVSWP